MRPGTAWTPEQVAYLRANFGHMPDDELAAQSGHSYRGWRHKVFALRLKRPRERRTVPEGARAGFELLVAGIARRDLTF